MFGFFENHKDTHHEQDEFDLRTNYFGLDSTLKYINIDNYNRLKSFTLQYNDKHEAKLNLSIDAINRTSGYPAFMDRPSLHIFVDGVGRIVSMPFYKKEHDIEFLKSYEIFEQFINDKTARKREEEKERQERLEKMQAEYTRLCAVREKHLNTINVLKNRLVDLMDDIGNDTVEDKMHKTINLINQLERRVESLNSDLRCLK
jgi:hypothetical protein